MSLRPRSVAELRAIVLGGETGRSNPGLPKAARDERMCWAVMCNKWVTWSHVVTQLVVTSSLQWLKWSATSLEIQGTEDYLTVKVKM